MFGLVACEPSGLDTTVSDGVQEDRETLTLANAHYFGDVNETADYRSSGKLYGSYLKAADGNVYYVGAGLVDVKFDGTTVKELHVKAYSVYGSEITYDYVAE